MPPQPRESDSIACVAPRIFRRLMFRLQSNRPCRHDVLDNHPAVLQYNPIDVLLYHLLLHLKRGGFHRPPDTGAKGIDPFQEPQLSGSIHPLLVDLLHLCSQHTPVLCNSLASLCQFGELNHLGLIGVNQPRHFSLDSGEFPLEARPFLFRPDIHRRVAAPLLVSHS